VAHSEICKKVIVKRPITLQACRYNIPSEIRVLKICADCSNCEFPRECECKMFTMEKYLKIWARLCCLSSFFDSRCSCVDKWMDAWKEMLALEYGTGRIFCVCILIRQKTSWTTLVSIYINVYFVPPVGLLLLLLLLAARQTRVSSVMHGWDYARKWGLTPLLNHDDMLVARWREEMRINQANYANCNK